MDVAHNGTAPEGLHGIAKNIPGRSLDDIFHELGPITFQPLPLLGGSDAFIGHGFPTELILPDPGLHVGKPPPTGEFDEQHAALTEEPEIVDLDGDPLFDGGFHSLIHLPPEIHDVGIGGPSGLDQRSQFFFRDPHIHGPHGLQSAHGAAVSAVMH